MYFKMWNNYWSDKGNWEPDYEKISKFYNKYFKKILPKNLNANILDLGCGRGTFCYFLRNCGYNNFRGIDISEESIKICQRLFPGKVFKKDAINYLELHQDEYDLIFMGDFLEHIKKENVMKYLTFSYESLKPRGKLLISVPNQSNPFGVISRYSDFTHEIGFTSKSLFQVLKIAGFEHIRIFSISRKNWIKKFIYILLKFIFEFNMDYDFFFARKIYSLSIKK